MASVNKQYDYSDFISLIDPYTSPDLDRLKKEIEDSTITITVDFINKDEASEKCDIWFKTDISSEEETTLEGIVGTHTGEPLAAKPQTVYAKQISTDQLDPETANTLYDGGEDDTGELCLDVQADEEVTSWSKTLDFPIEPVGGEAFIPDDDTVWSYGDKLDFYMIPPNAGVIGQLAQNADSGATEVYVDATAVVNLKPGFFIKIGSEDFFYKIKAIDYSTAKLTLYKALNEGKAQGDYIHLRVYYLRRWPVWKGVKQEFATMTPGAKNVPAGWTISMEYHHKESTHGATKWYFGLAYEY